MTYAQIKRGLRMHLVYEPGEGRRPTELTPAGHLGAPLCGLRVERYRMSCNLPLANACKNCLRVWRSRREVKS